jgi:peptidoglycan hydrolase-like protein with peptidoglycan-binding domain
LLLCVSLAPAKTAAKSSQRRSTTTAQKTGKRAVTSKSARRRGKKRPRKARSQGQQAIDPVRARQIQAALIREHYLDGEPSGVWDQRTKDAMSRFQAAHGWQTKVLPDSRALIKLGLGPTHEGALNFERTSIDRPVSGGGSDTTVTALPR